MKKTRVAVKSRGPGNTHREGTNLQLSSPAICVCVWLCVLVQKTCRIALTARLYTPGKFVCFVN